MDSEVMMKPRSIPADLRPRLVPAGADAPRVSSVRLLLPALATAGLLWLCHFPVAWGWLGWVALVPLLCLLRVEASGWRAALFAWVAGLAFYWPALQWMRLADERMYATWAVLSTHCSLFFLLAFCLVRRLDRRTGLPLIVTLPVVWTAIEFCRANFPGGFATYFLGHAQHDLPGGFAWYFLAHTQHDALAVIQIADLTGAYGVTFVVAAVNALIFELLCTQRWFRALGALPESASRLRGWGWLLQPAAILLLLGASLGYGAWRLNQDDFSAGPRIALIQGNLPQNIRNSAVSDLEASTTMLRHFMRLSDAAAARFPKAELIVWPETSYPDDWTELAPDCPPAELSTDSRESLKYAEALTRFCSQRWRTNVLLGLNANVLRPDQKISRYNSTLLIQADGKPAGRYDKIHRVPFGEFVPFRHTLPWMNRFAPYNFDYSIQAGEYFTRFPLDRYRFGVIICYEDTDPALARQYGRPSGEGPAADFLINVSNDGWFIGSSEHEEHLAICRFRAIEARRSVARAVNMGVSAVIDGNGRVLAPRWLIAPGARGLLGPVPPLPFPANLPWGSLYLSGHEVQQWEVPAPEERPASLPVSQWRHFKKIEGVLTANLPLDRRTSLYSLWGDWMPWTCVGLLVLGLVGSFVSFPPRRSLPAEAL